MSWFQKIKSAIVRSSEKISLGIGDIFLKGRRLDDEAMEELEEILLTSDLGIEVTNELLESLKKERFGTEITSQEVRQHMADRICEILQPYAKDIEVNCKPFIVMVCGVNGNGKTTTIGKIAKNLVNAKFSVSLAACDTFRAAAVEQLAIWADRSGAELIRGAANSDPASVAYEAVQKSRDKDVILIDTAGRLQNKTNLMAELEKIQRVIKKIDENAPHERILVLDATTGQNAHSQVEAFSKAVNLSGLVITKLDGTAKGGVVVALAKKFKLPIYAIGIGEGADDLKPFDARDFANALMGIG